MFEKKAESVGCPKSILPQTNQVQTQLQQQFSHLSSATVETIVNYQSNKSASETMTSSESESKFDDDQTPKLDGSGESLPAKDDSTPQLDGDNSLDSSSSSSGSDTDNVGKSTSGDLWSSGSSDDETPKKVSWLHVTRGQRDKHKLWLLIHALFFIYFSQSLVDYESRDSDDDNADEDLKDDDAPATKKARLDLEWRRCAQIRFVNK